VKKFQGKTFNARQKLSRPPSVLSLKSSLLTLYVELSENRFMSSEDDPQTLKTRIAELEKEVAQREQDLAHFRKELAQANSKLEQLISSVHWDLKKAEQIQKILVPTELPTIPGFEFSHKFLPSIKSGGDYLDIFEHEDRLRFGVIVSSASGYAMSSLLLTALLKFTGRMEARQGAGPHQILKHILGSLQPEMSEEDSVSLFYSLIDRRNFEVNFSFLGEIYVFHQDYAEQKVEFLTPPSTPFSKDTTLEFQKFHATLNPRDRLIIASRGIIEAENLEGEKFGQERLYQCLIDSPHKSVHQLRNKILYSVEKFSAGQKPPRDITVVVMEVKDRVIKLAQ